MALNGTGVMNAQLKKPSLAGVLPDGTHLPCTCSPLAVVPMTYSLSLL